MPHRSRLSGAVLPAGDEDAWAGPSLRFSPKRTRCKTSPAGEGYEPLARGHSAARGPVTIGVMVRSRGYGSYTAGPWLRRRGKRHSFLRTAQLNAVGWAALFGACLVAAAAGVGAAVAIAVPRWWGAVLGVLPLAAVVMLDRRRWAAMQTSFGWGGSEVDVARIVSELAELGIITSVRTEPNAEGWGEPADRWGELELLPTGDRVIKTASLRYRNRDRGVVERTLRTHGIYLPDLP